jgi:two-component system response regulator DesR
VTDAPGSVPRRARVVLADDHAAVAHEVRRLLEPEFEVAAVVGDGEALVAATAALRPDLVVTDIAMPVLDGVAALQRIRMTDPTMPVVCLTVMTGPEVRQRALEAGAAGFVSKAAAGSELIPALRAALRGRGAGTR